MNNENNSDEITNSPVDYFRTNVYFLYIDKIKVSLTIRFKDARNIMKDLSFLSYERLMKVSNGDVVPKDTFDSLKIWIPEIDKDSIGMEYRNFAISFQNLQSSICPEQLHDEDVLISENTSDEDDSIINSEMDDEEIVHNSSKKMVSPTQIFELLNSFKLASAFPNLYIAYKSLCTIPTTSVSSERSFSKVKLVKTRLRSTIGQDRLEGLLLYLVKKIFLTKLIFKKLSIRSIIGGLLCILVVTSFSSSCISSKSFNKFLNLSLGKSNSSVSSSILPISES
ncbi:hypothetical protein QTP88_010333 [Uroleucon formosanum]